MTIADNEKPIFVYSRGPSFINSLSSTKYQFELFRTPAGGLCYREGHPPAADDRALAEIEQEFPEVYAKLMSWTDSAVSRPVPEEKVPQVLQLLHIMRAPRNKHAGERDADGNTGGKGWPAISDQWRHLTGANAYSILYMYSFYPEDPMDAVSYTAARSNLAKSMERVCESHEPLIITRNKAPSVVMISLEDYEALEETAYLLRSPANARRLLESIKELAEKGGQERELHE